MISLLSSIFGTVARIHRPCSLLGSTRREETARAVVPSQYAHQIHFRLVHPKQCINALSPILQLFLCLIHQFSDITILFLLILLFSRLTEAALELDFLISRNLQFNSLAGLNSRGISKWKDFDSLYQWTFSDIMQWHKYLN